MKRIKFPKVFKPGTEKILYPDDDMLFSNVDSMGEYFHADYTGAKSFPAGEYPKTGLINILIKSMSGDLPGFDNENNEYTMEEGKVFTAKADLAVPNRVFRVPFKRTDTGRIQYIKAEVSNGVATISGIFKTSGEWVLNSELLNSEFPAPLFSIVTTKFKVI